jgi:hypothetical protein
VVPFAAWTTLSRGLKNSQRLARHAVYSEKFVTAIADDAKLAGVLLTWQSLARNIHADLVTTCAVTTTRRRAELGTTC